MLALGLQTLLLMSAAYCLGAALACGVRRLLFLSARRVPIEVARHVEPLPQLDAGVVGTRRFVPVGAPATIPSEPQTAPLTSPRQTAAAGEPSAPQDLKHIATIDAATEAALNQLGINRYDQISRWRRADVERIAQALGVKRQRISRENWIEQAQMLATGAQTHFAQRRARGETVRAAPSADQGERRQLRAAAHSSAPPSAPPAAATVPGPPPLSAGAVVARPQAPVAPPGAARGAAPSAAPPAVSQRAAFARAPAPAAEPPAPVLRSTVAEPAPGLRAGAAPVVGKSAPGLVEPARPIRPLPPSEVDNLQRIRGIDAELARRLATAGIKRYEEIAAWSAADVERFDRDLAGAGRIARENWIEQAQILMKGGATAFSRAFDRGSPGAPIPLPEAPAAAGEATAAGGPESAPPARPFLLGALRSVRSQAYQNPEPGPEAAYRVGSHNRVVRSGPPQDLKRIRGIGVLIEKRLNAMQIATYEQIANWTAQDIERVSRVLDFKGRIERENWVEQARILASGGATEFSRRVDRGDVETGRYRP